MGIQSREPVYLKQVLGIVLVVLMGVPIDAIAEKSSWSVGGRIRQGVSLAYDHENGSDYGPSNFLGELNIDYKPSRQFAINADFWLRGDLLLSDKGDFVDTGIQDFNSPNFRKQFNYRIYNDKDSFTGNTPFGDDSEEIKLLDGTDEVIRDLTLSYQTANRSMQFKVGKFQHGWGQSDGLRLIDILNPQDFRGRFVLNDAQDMRIPQTGLAMTFDLSRLGMGAPFKFIGLERTAFEVVYYPQVLHSWFVVNNPTPSDQTSGGIFGFAFPELLDPESGRGLPGIGVNLHDIEHEEWDYDDGELGVRMSFEALDATWTLNGFYGYQDLPVVTLKGATLLVGTNYNDPSQALLSIPLDRETAIFATWGPGMYMDQLRALGGQSSPFGPNSGLGAALGNIPIVGELVGNLSDGLAPLLCTGTDLIVIEGCSVNFDFNLDYDYRQKVVATSVTREMKEITLGRKQVSPVLRVEASYEFDKPFNNMVTETGFNNQGVGSAALVTQPENAISTSDQVGLMVGFDFPLWIPYMESQRNSIFTSFQFFDFYTKDHENKVYQAPYMFNELEEHQRYATALWIWEIFNESIVLEGLYARDISNESNAYRQRVDFNFFGDKIRPRFEWVTFDAVREDGALGFVHDADMVELSLTYQF